MRFKIGDKVRVREDLEVDKRYGREFFVGGMERYRGEVMEIDDTWNSAGYNLKEDDENWLFTDEMFEPVEKYKTDAEIMQELIEGRNEKVNSPSHYTRGDIEVIDIIKQLTQGYEPFEAYLVGNAIKYLARANFKENKRRDLEKAQWHINKLLEEEE